MTSPLAPQDFPPPPEDIASFRADLSRWLDAHHAELSPNYAAPGELDDHVGQMQRVKRLLWNAGFMQCGWPERVGGRGGSPMMRIELGAQIAARDYADPGLFSLIEVLAPTVIDYAPTELAAEMIPLLLSGSEMWCQGFSEPGSGSDLASLACRATPKDGDPETATTWVVNGQKVWTSLAQYSERCVLLTRTGSPESRHRGISAFFVDMDTPGISVAPLEMMNGELEFAEVFFDDVEVPAERMFGGLHGGWGVAMSILPYERSSCFWQRIGYLYTRLQRLVEAAPETDGAAAALGESYAQLHALRSRSRLTQHRLANEGTIGADTSIDKVLIASAEQSLFDQARALLPGVVEFDDSPSGHEWRLEYLYSRAASIYGGNRRSPARHHLPSPAGSRRLPMIDEEDRALLEKTIEGALAESEPGSDADPLLAELDWVDLLTTETDDAIDLVFRALGRFDVRSSALDDVLLHALGHEPDPDVAVVLPPFGRWDPPALSESAEHETIAVTGLTTGRGARGVQLLAPCGPVETPRAILFDAAEAARTPLGGLDPDFGYQSIQYRGAASEGPLAPEQWQRAIALGRRAVAAQIAGANRRMLEMARTHAVEREQFGSPIAQFQTVRHRLSETLVAVESTEACLASAQAEPNAATAAMAKALASRNARIVARHCQQILAGVGFTTEHAFHRYLKRVMPLEGLFGTADAILLDIGREMLRTRQAPTLIEL